ncbi:MAG: hypothetical protein FWG52_08030 [Proteobacteria bacterium]|nr:hypothetical protein [Pseudomonadota bacterium]
MFGKRFGFIHGWVVGIQASTKHEECLLTVRLGNARTIMLTVQKPDWLLKSGNEISVAVKNSNPTHAVALVDHSAGDGAILPCSDHHRYWEDAVIAAVLLAMTLVVSGWNGLPVYALLLVLYGLARVWLPEAIRRRDATTVSYLIDEDYRRWREARDGEASLTEA